MRFWLKFILIFAFLSAKISVYGQFSPGELSSAHAYLDGMKNCTKCHELGSAVSETKCLDCHVEIKNLKKAKRGFHSNPSTSAKSCVSCHSEHHGAKFDAARFDTSTFDHKTALYELKGGHADVSCAECHQKKNIRSVQIAKRKGTYLGLRQDCLSCHEDEHRNQMSPKCLDCHSIEDWKPARGFDHQKTDFALRGAHATVKCAECHSEARDAKGSYRRYSELAHASCTDCHRDQHNGRLGTNCTSCHSVWNWKVKNAQSQFDHSLTRFPLEGLHQGVACSECHKKRGSAVPFARCTSCHDDYHKGDFAQAEGGIQDCKTCHSVEMPFTWSSYGIEEHQKGTFPLEGGHLATPCTSCHQKNEDQWSFSLSDTKCTSCHENSHEGALDAKFLSPKGCTECHSTERWAAVHFDHSKTGFKLDGRHVEVACSACHMPNGIEKQQFKLESKVCAACHEDPHGGQFAERQNQAMVDCKECHGTESAWKAVNFNHANSRFPLEGKHATAACSACHKTETANESSVVKYRINKLQCIDCHGS